MNRHLSFIIFLILSICSFSQLYCQCNNPSKKVLKLIDKALNSKDNRISIQLFDDALNKGSDNARVYYEYGMYVYNLSLINNQNSVENIQKSKDMLTKSRDLCNDFHANISFYLGVINYSQGEYTDAIKWFKEFKEFNHSNPDKYPDDYINKVSQVDDVLVELENNILIKSKVVPYNPKLVDNVSTSNNEYFPMISPDNELMFYTRQLDRSDLGSIRSNVVEEITFSKRKIINSSFDSGKPLAEPFNNGSVNSYGAATLSVDNKEMIICACKKEKIYGQDYMNCDLYTTTFEISESENNKFKWSELKNMGDKINTPNGWEGQPSLSSDGNTLFYVVNRPDSRDNDIYIVRREENGHWGDARPFNEINTDGKDKSPFIHQDSETLYFVSECSKNRPGLGGLDIFYTRCENGIWSTPKNIGYPINSRSDELGLFVSIDGQTAYFSSRQSGNWDIYSFELYEDARPKPVAVIKGELKDEYGASVKDAIIEIAYEESGDLNQIKVNGSDGKYAAIVKKNKKEDIMITVKKSGYSFDSRVINRSEFEKNDIVFRDKNLSLKKIKLNESYTINDILFETNSFELNNLSKFILKGFKRFLDENPTIKVSVQGHTDDIGDYDNNLTLSNDRARIVKDYLIFLGIKEERLLAKGFGESKPKFENNSFINRAKNRRTDFVILEM